MNVLYVCVCIEKEYNVVLCMCMCEGVRERSDLEARGAAVFILQGSAVSLLFFDLVREHADS